MTQSIDLGNGTILQFDQITAYDFLSVQDQLGCSLGDADQFKASLALAWRAGVAGGYPSGFDKFCKSIPIDKVAEVVEASRPFFSMGGGESKESLPSSETD